MTVDAVDDLKLHNDNNKNNTKYKPSTVSHLRLGKYLPRGPIQKNNFRTKIKFKIDGMLVMRCNRNAHSLPLTRSIPPDSHKLTT